MAGVYRVRYPQNIYLKKVNLNKYINKPDVPEPVTVGFIRSRLNSVQFKYILTR